MSDYLLPCACGQSINVSAAKAGQQVRCECGALVDVPTLRGLAELPRPASKAPRRGTAWNNRHRLALVLVVLAGLSLAVAAKLAASLPPSPTTHSTQEFEAWASGASPEVVFNMYNQFRGGLTHSVENDESQAQRTLMVGAIITAVGFAGGCLIFAVLAQVLRRPGPPSARSR